MRQKYCRIPWHEVDWTKPTSEIARELRLLGVQVSQARRLYAPETVNRVRKFPPVDWSKVDWSAPTSEIAIMLGVSVSQVSGARVQFAPQTLGKVRAAGEWHTKVDWSAVDRTKSLRALARELKCSVPTVRRYLALSAPKV